MTLNTLRLILAAAIVAASLGIAATTHGTAHDYDYVLVEELPFACDTDGDCEAKMRAFGCEEADPGNAMGAGPFVCDAALYAETLARFERGEPWFRGE